MPSSTITNVEAEIVPASADRYSIIFQNEDASIDVFLQQSEVGDAAVSTTSHDHRLAAGGTLSVTFREDGQKKVQGRWVIIAASGTPLVSVLETEDIRR